MVLIAGMTHLATAGAFTDAGIWAAIVAGGIALLAALGGLARWIRRTLRASDFEGALYPAQTVLQFNRERPGEGLVQFNAPSS